jgi:hypothetical protein
MQLLINALLAGSSLAALAMFVAIFFVLTSIMASTLIG